MKDNIELLVELRSITTRAADILESIGMGFQGDEYRGVALKTCDEVRSVLLANAMKVEKVLGTKLPKY